MPGYFITIDAGTTRTRAYLWDARRRLVGVERRETGVRDTAVDGDNRRLKAAVRECLESLLRGAGLEYADVDRVLASGMITSNVGLLEIPHLPAPVSLDDLARGTRPARVADVCPLPIHFIPGVKNSDRAVTEGDFESMDIMRGEEVETFALLEQLGARGDWLIVLPGSHTKFVSVDGEGRVTGCLTSITGELLASITGHTILADAVDRRFVGEDSYCRDMMLLGLDTAEAVGLGRACFSARILSQFAEETPERLANYLLGACLQSDLAAVKNSTAISRARSALVAGRGAMCLAMADAFRHAGAFDEVRHYDPGDTPLSGLGALAVSKRLDEITE